jgi:hypothetical protein
MLYIPSFLSDLKRNTLLKANFIADILLLRFTADFFTFVRCRLDGPDLPQGQGLGWSVFGPERGEHASPTLTLSP